MRPLGERRLKRGFHPPPLEILPSWYSRPSDLNPNLHWLVEELLLNDVAKEPVHVGALLETGVHVQREVDV